MIYGEAPGFLALMAASRRGGRLSRPRSTYWPWPEATGDAVAWVIRKAERDQEVYHCAHLLREYRWRKVTAALLSTLYVDLDHADLDHPAVLEPSIVVESSPGRLQCYWRLTEPVEPIAGEALNRRLAAALRADPSGWDLTQLLRVSGTRNRKYPDAPLVRTLALTGRRYDPDALAASPPEPASRELSNRVNSHLFWRAVGPLGAPLHRIGPSPPHRKRAPDPRWGVGLCPTRGPAGPFRLGGAYGPRPLWGCYTTEAHRRDPGRTL